MNKDKALEEAIFTALKNYACSEMLRKGVSEKDMSIFALPMVTLAYKEVIYQLSTQISFLKDPD